jgi:hypothetical protein
MNTLHCDKFWAWFFAVLWRSFWKWRPVEIFQCQESIRDIIIYLLLRILQWNLSKLNFLGISFCVLRIDKCSVYAGWISKDFLHRNFIYCLVYTGLRFIQGSVFVVLLSFNRYQFLNSTQNNITKEVVMLKMLNWKLLKFSPPDYNVHVTAKNQAQNLSQCKVFI